MPSRIAFCITTLEPGGAERQLVELAIRLPRDHFEPAIVVLAPPPKPPADELVRRLAAESIKVSFLGGRSILQAQQIQRGLAEWLHQARPDLLQCFLAHANVLGALAARRLGMPIVAGIRVAEQRLNGHRLAQRLTQRWTDRYVCVSEDVANYADRRMRLRAEKLLVIRNGVDVAKFADAEPISWPTLGLSSQRGMILFVGRLEADKRPDWLLDRMPEIAARLPNHDLVIAGRGPLEASLRTQAARLGVAGRVHFLGWRNDVPRLLAAADLLLLTSSSEGMPNAILEAMAAARAVVATDVHGIRELLGDDVDQVVPPLNAERFIDAATRLATDRARASEVGLRNRERARSGFSLDATAAAYAALYESLLTTPRLKKSPRGR